MNCAETKEINLILLMVKMGATKTHTKSKDVWFYSPFRDEKTASFKVNTQLNKWYDHGIGKGGGPIEFIKTYYSVDTSEALRIANKLFSTGKIECFIKQSSQLNESEESNSLLIKAERPLNKHTAFVLMNYLNDRCINNVVASKYCRTIYYTFPDRVHKGMKDLFAVGFKNDSGGWELSSYKNSERKEKSKYCSAPKDITTIKGTKKNRLLVFEGFIDFLSYLTNVEIVVPDYTAIVLNSLSFLDSAIELSKSFDRTYLYLDNDSAGKEASKKFIEQNPNAVNKSEIIFPAYKDYNEYLIDTML